MQKATSKIRHTTFILITQQNNNAYPNKKQWRAILFLIIIIKRNAIQEASGGPCISQVGKCL